LDEMEQLVAGQRTAPAHDAEHGGRLQSADLRCANAGQCISTLATAAVTELALSATPYMGDEETTGSDSLSVAHNRL
jgi:hypothetical protein